MTLMKVAIIPVQVSPNTAQEVSAAISSKFDLEPTITPKQEPPENDDGILNFLTSSKVTNGEELMQRIDKPSKYHKHLIVYNDVIKDGEENVRFGISYQDGSCGMISTHILDRDSDKLMPRLQKEAIKHFGYMLGLHHCDNPKCVLTRTTNVSELDKSSKNLCGECRVQLQEYMFNNGTKHKTTAEKVIDGIETNEFGELRDKS